MKKYFIPFLALQLFWAYSAHAEQKAGFFGGLLDRLNGSPDTVDSDQTKQEEKSPGIINSLLKVNQSLPGALQQTTQKNRKTVPVTDARGAENAELDLSLIAEAGGTIEIPRLKIEEVKKIHADDPANADEKVKTAVEFFESVQQMPQFSNIVNSEATDSSTGQAGSSWAPDLLAEEEEDLPKDDPDDGNPEMSNAMDQARLFANSSFLDYQAGAMGHNAAPEGNSNEVESFGTEMQPDQELVKAEAYGKQVEREVPSNAAMNTSQMVDNFIVTYPQAQTTHEATSPSHSTTTASPSPSYTTHALTVTVDHPGGEYTISPQVILKSNYPAAQIRYCLVEGEFCCNPKSDDNYLRYQKPILISPKNGQFCLAFYALAPGRKNTPVTQEIYTIDDRYKPDKPSSKSLDRK